MNVKVTHVQMEETVLMKSMDTTAYAPLDTITRIVKMVNQQ